MDLEFNEKGEIVSYWNCGTYKYMSITVYYKKRPTILDDIESLMYNILDASEIQLS